MLIPSQIIITHVRPSYWLPGLEVIWGILTGVLALSHNAKMIYAVRSASNWESSSVVVRALTTSSLPAAFIGFCEASAYPGSITVRISFPLRPPHLLTDPALSPSLSAASHVVVHAPGACQAR